MLPIMQSSTGRLMKTATRLHLHWKDKGDMTGICIWLQGLGQYLQHSPSCIPEGPADAIGEHLIRGLQQRGGPCPEQDTEA